jgi:hypothetical protein
MYDSTDDWDIFLNLDDFGQTATVGAVAGIKGIFDTESEIIQGDGTSIRGYAPTFTIFSGDIDPKPYGTVVSNITDTTSGDIWPKEYTVIDIEDDGWGMLTLILQEVS